MSHICSPSVTEGYSLSAFFLSVEGASTAPLELNTSQSGLQSPQIMHDLRIMGNMYIENIIDNIYSTDLYL